MKPIVDRGILAFTPYREAKSTICPTTEIVYQLIHLNQSLTIANMKIEDEHFKSYILN